MLQHINQKQIVISLVALLLFVHVTLSWGCMNDGFLFLSLIGAGLFYFEYRRYAINHPRLITYLLLLLALYLALSSLLNAQSLSAFSGIHHLIFGATGAIITIKVIILFTEKEKRMIKILNFTITALYIYLLFYWASDVTLHYLDKGFMFNGCPTIDYLRERYPVVVL